MGWLADVLQELPLSAALKAKLERKEQEYTELQGQLRDAKLRIEHLEADLAKHRQPDGLAPDEVSIIKYLAITGQELPVQAIAAHLEVHPTRVEHLLKKLVDAEYVYMSLNMISGASYSIGDRGREYAVSNNFV